MNTRMPFLDPLQADRAFIESSTPLLPSDAAAALIQPRAGRYLMQLRDPFDWIFFPGHWGLFGGAIEEGESGQTTLARELREELELDVAEQELSYFTRLDLDLSCAGHGAVRREFYNLTISPERVRTLRLKEGAGLRVFTAEEVLLEPRVTPYDLWAIWVYEARSRLTATSCAPVTMEGG